MPFCSNCGKEVALGAKFCNNCGAAQPADGTVAMGAPAAVSQVLTVKRSPLFRITTWVNLIVGVLSVVAGLIGLGSPGLAKLAAASILFILGLWNLVTWYYFRKPQRWYRFPALAMGVVILVWGLLTIFSPSIFSIFWVVSGGLTLLIMLRPEGKDAFARAP